VGGVASPRVGCNTARCSAVWAAHHHNRYCLDAGWGPARPPSGRGPQHCLAAACCCGAEGRASPVCCYSQQWPGAGQAVGHASAGAGVTARCTAECSFWAPQSAGNSAHSGAPPGSHAKVVCARDVNWADGTTTICLCCFTGWGKSYIVDATGQAIIARM